MRPQNSFLRFSNGPKNHSSDALPAPEIFFSFFCNNVVWWFPSPLLPERFCIGGRVTRSVVFQYSAAGSAMTRLGYSVLDSGAVLRFVRLIAGMWTSVSIFYPVFISVFDIFRDFYFGFRYFSHSVFDIFPTF